MVATDKVYELIAAHTTDLICIHDLENTVRFATPSCKDILGVTQDQLIGKKLTDFLAQEFIAEMDFTTLRRFFDNPGSRIRYQIKFEGQRLRWLESTFTPISDKSETYAMLSSTRDITESVHLTDDLMSALASEQKFSQFKANLYSVASHEFKTPLAVMQANIELLRIKKDGRFLENALDTMEEEIDRLNSMIADMLELKKLNTGKINLRPENLDMEVLIEELKTQECKKAFENINVDLQQKGEKKLIKADYSLVRYIFSNLLVNACKFSSPGNKVLVIIDYAEDMLKVSIQDFGIGIPKKDHDSIFSSFYRASNVGNIGGTGVGLSIVKEFVDLHKGKISFISASGEGSTFFVELPYSIEL